MLVKYSEKCLVAPHSHSSKYSAKVVAVAANPHGKTLMSVPEVQLKQNSCRTAPGKKKL